MFVANWEKAPAPERRTFFLAFYKHFAPPERKKGDFNP